MFGVSLILFALQMTFSPERRAMVFVTTPQQADNIPELIKQYGFDKPYHIQYLRWLSETAKGNLGYSLVAASPVLTAFWRYLPVTLELVLFSSPCIILFGIWLGTKAGSNPNTFVDHFSRIFAIVGWSLPTFLFGLLLMMVFYGYFGILPPGVISDEFTMTVLDGKSGFVRYTHLITIDGILNGRFDIAWDAAKYLVLPIIAQVIVICALLMRVLRSGMLEEMSKDYVITARAKGADEKTVILKHAKRNAMIPVITLSGQLVAALMPGSIAVEYVFNRTGIGWWVASSATQLDTPVLMAISLFMALVFVTANLIVDILYAYIDPRIRLS